MLSHATNNRETHDAIERYVIAAIVDAREVYTDLKWLAWADHWIAGRDRSFASARRAHRMALRPVIANLRRWPIVRAGCPESSETDIGRSETPAELAAWAAGLALVATPMALDLTAGIRRMGFALRTRFGSDAHGPKCEVGCAVDTPVPGRPRGGASPARGLQADSLGGSADGAAYSRANRSAIESSRRQ